MAKSGQVTLKTAKRLHAWQDIGFTMQAMSAACQAAYLVHDVLQGAPLGSTGRGCSCLGLNESSCLMVGGQDLVEVAAPAVGLHAGGEPQHRLVAGCQLHLLLSPLHQALPLNDGLESSASGTLSLWDMCIVNPLQQVG